MVMRMTIAGIFIFLSFENQWREPHMLDRTIEQASRDPCKERGEDNSPDHGKACSVTGKADGVARVMRRIVQLVGMGKPDAGNQQEAKGHDAEARGDALRQ